MSHLNVKGGPLADKRNVLGVFSKHFKSQLKTPVPANNANSCCKYCSHADGPETVDSNVMSVKEKRLKSRKERDHIRNGCRGQKMRWHSRPKKSSRREHRERELCHGSCQPLSHSHKREQFEKSFAPKEPSFITERRLLGHQGLFNHEVKSFDIERLLSEERKAEKSQKQLNHTNQKAFSPMLSPTQNSDDDKKCPPNQKYEMSRKSSRQGASAETGCGDAVRSQTGLQSEDTRDSLDHRSGASPCQRKTKRMDCSPSESNSVVILSSTPKSSVSDNIPQSTPRITDGYNCPKIHRAGSPSQAAPYNTNAQHSECTPTGLKYPVSHPKAQRVHKVTPDLLVAKDTSSSSQDQKAKSETERSQLEAKVAKHLISVVAGRLCQSLDRPLLLRHHLLADSRATLLHVLQERHGTLLQQNLLKLHTRLGLEQSQVGTGCGTEVHSNAMEEKWTAAVIDVQSSSLGPGPVQQSWLRSKEKPVSKRRRKQTCPQRRTPPSPPLPQGPFSESLQGTGPRKSQAWTLNMGTEQEVLMEPSDPTFRPDPFSAGDQTTNIFLTGGNTFSSRWGPHTALSQSWNKRLGQEKIFPQTMRDPYEKWRHDPDLSFLCPTEYQGQHKHPFSSYKAMPPDGALREPEHLTVHPQFDCKRQLACSPGTAHTSLKNLHLQPYYRFHHPLTSASSSLTSYRPDMSFYPPSELLDAALSPPKHPSASPEGWSYPRMRLY